jgi:hypothetical protein
MRLLIEVNIPQDYEGKHDLGQAMVQTQEAMLRFPTDLRDVDSFTLPVRDYNGNRIGRLTVDQEPV